MTQAHISVPHYQKAEDDVITITTYVCKHSQSTLPNHVICQWWESLQVLFM